MKTVFHCIFFFPHKKVRWKKDENGRLYKKIVQNFLLEYLVLNIFVKSYG